MFNSFKLYNERAKRWHDQRIINRDFKVGGKVLLFNSKTKLFHGMLVSRWSGPFEVVEEKVESGSIVDAVRLFDVGQKGP